MKTFFTSLLLFLLISPLVLPQNSEAKIKVTVTINPYDLTIGNPFTLSLLVDYPVPEDVSVVMPKFAGSFVLDRYVRAPRVNPAGVKQTSFEFRLIPNEGGIIEIESISVITPNGIIQTEPVIFNIRGGQEERFTALRLVWEAPQQISAGDRVTLILRVNSSEQANPLPPPSFFMPEVPRNVILSNLSLSPQDKEGGVVLKLTLIPLSAGNFILPARTLQQENTQQRQRIRFEIPVLNIRVTEKTQ
ncbi:MAG: BatD family protein [Treponema sp.]|nr:BatD family protein [Treponema sp.]